MVNIPYALLLGVIVVIASLVGISQVNRIVAKTGRQSIIIIMLFIILSLSCFLLPFKYILK